MVALNRNKFTTIELRILELLKDGNAHKRDNVFQAVFGDDKNMQLNNLQIHIHNIRRKLNMIGQTIVCEVRGYWVGYRWVILLNEEAKGYV